MSNLLLFIYALLLPISCLLINAYVYIVPRELKVNIQGFFKAGYNLKSKSIAIYICTALLHYISYLRFGLSPQLFMSFFVLSSLVAVSFIDFEFQIIPDRFWIIILILGIINLFISDKSLTSHIIGFFAISVPFLIVALITNGLGGGDVKLMAAAGLYLGLQNILLSVIVGSIIGCIYALILLSRKKANKKTEMPFGPFLSIGIIIALLYGDSIIEWYFMLFI